MQFENEFTPLAQSSVHDDAAQRLDEGWRYVQILAVNKDDGVDLVYSYMKDGLLDNAVVSDVPRDAHIPSISDVFLEAFVCENEIHDLFGVAFDGIAIDFLGNFYRVSTEYPMTIVSPEQLAEREKQKKIAAAKAAKEAKARGEGERTAGDASEEDMEAKLASMDPEKAAKVRAALEAKAANEKKAKEAELEAKLASMDPAKAAKVRAAMEAKAAKEGE